MGIIITSSLYPGPDAIYSGLLECPLTTRVRKVINSNYLLQGKGRCATAIDTASECFQAVTKLLGMNGTMRTSAIDDAGLPAGCLVVASGMTSGPAAVFNKNNSSSCAKGSSPTPKLVGTASSLVSLSVTVDAAKNEVEILAAGPADVWWGVGFNASNMGDQPWTIVVSNGTVSEHRLADQSPGTELERSVTVVSNTVQGGVRNVKLICPIAGKYFTFPTDATRLPFINAVGSSPVFAYHKNKAPAALELLPIGTPVCVCAGESLPFGTGAAKGAWISTAARTVSVCVY